MAAENLLIQILAQGFGGLLTNLTTSYTQKTARKIKEGRDDIKRDLRDHLENTFNKCIRVKTILDSDQPAGTLDIYVDQHFRINGDLIDQYSMVEKIRDDTSTIILGEGGGGKSMFMRYLWLSYFEKSDGKIPFFLELRNLNSVSHTNISDFIYHSIIKSGSSIRQSEFTSALKEGEFILFLDGFDEINFDRRDDVQDMILDLKDENPKLTIVVTSRDDERFMGWASFIRALVMPLSKERSNILIQKANCDPDIRHKFLRRFDSLWDRHSDFLSNPLLAYMMLVTFSYNPDIPRKMFQFYEQAFEALYHRHDLTKGYKRKFQTDLDKFDFIRIISYLCLKTYYDGDLEFSRVELAHAIESVKKIEGSTVEAEALINDLVQSVCIIKAEGLTYTFTHRSFQEYFAAYCIARVAARNIDVLFSNFAKRHSDKVLPMVVDINPDLFREKYVIPNYKKFSKFFDRKTERHLYLSFAKRVGAEFLLRDLKFDKVNSKRQPQKDFSFSLSYRGEMSDFYHTIKTVTSQKFILEGEKNHADDIIFAVEAKKIVKDTACNIRIKFEDEGVSFYLINRGGQIKKFAGADHDLLKDAFLETRMHDFLRFEAKRTFDFVRSEVSRHNVVSTTFSDLF